jgi:hypothetical protein
MHASRVEVTGIEFLTGLPRLRAHGRHRRTRQRPRGMVKMIVTVTCAAMFIVMPNPGWAGRADTVTRHAPVARTGHSTLEDYARVLRSWER